MKAGITGIPCDNNTEFFPCVVTYEPLYPNQLFTEIIHRELKQEGVPEFDFELMSIEDLEWLLSWAMYENPFDFLRAKWTNPEWKIMNIRELVGIKIKENGLKDVKNPLLDQVFKKFWQRIVPEL
jgi:hypothetical protein